MIVIITRTCNHSGLIEKHMLSYITLLDLIALPDHVWCTNGAILLKMWSESECVSTDNKAAWMPSG
jgi:hypothetical protein